VPIITTIVSATSSITNLGHRLYGIVRGGIADVRVRDYHFDPNPNAPYGWQPTITVWNRGPGTAHATLIWLRTPDGPEPPPWAIDRHNANLLVGAPLSQRFDIPEHTPDAPPTIWIYWNDRRGLRKRNTRTKIIPPEPE
jgi:hypothetical protein